MLDHNASQVSPGCTSVEYVRWPMPLPRSIDSLHVARRCRPDHRLSDRNAVNHLRQCDGIRRTTLRRDGKRLERRAGHVMPLRLPDLCLAFDRLELAGAE